MTTFAERVRASGLPMDQLVVIGSGLLDQLGLRTSSDIDLAIHPTLFETLKRTGEYDVRKKYDTECLERDDYEIWTDWGADAPFETLRSEGQTIDGVRFVSTALLIERKRERGLEKDIRDIALLEAWRDGAR